MKLIRRILDNQAAMWCLFGCYLAVVLRLTVLRDGFWPLHPLQGGVLDLLPLAYYARWARRSLAGLLIREFAGNIVGFVPLGAFVRWRHREGGVSRALWTGGALSALIETAQIVFGVGRCSAGDVVLNALGALLGALLMNHLLSGKEPS